MPEKYSHPPQSTFNANQLGGMALTGVTLRSDGSLDTSRAATITLERAQHATPDTHNAAIIEGYANPMHTKQLQELAAAHVTGGEAYAQAFELSHKDITAVQAYRFSASEPINRHLRTGSRLRDENQRHLDRLRGIYARDTTPHTQSGEVVFRGGGPAFAPEYQDPGFLSTATTPKSALRFAMSQQNQSGAGYLYRLVAEPGLAFLPMNNAEDEVAFQDGLMHSQLAVQQRGTPGFAAAMNEMGLDPNTPIEGVIDELLSRPQVSLQAEGK